MRVLFLLAVLAAVGYGLWLVGQRVWKWWDARRTAKSKWTVETRPRKRLIRDTPPEGGDEWLVVLRRPGQEQVFRTVTVGDDNALLEAQAEADAHAHVLNEGRRK